MGLMLPVVSSFYSSVPYKNYHSLREDLRVTDHKRDTKILSPRGETSTDRHSRNENAKEEREAYIYWLKYVTWSHRSWSQQQGAVPGAMLFWEKLPQITCLCRRKVESPTSVGRGTEAGLSESQVKFSLPGVLSLSAVNSGLYPWNSTLELKR